jgi:hypothetical protein
MVVYSMHLMMDNDTKVDTGLYYTDYNMLTGPTCGHVCTTTSAASCPPADLFHYS